MSFFKKEELTNLGPFYLVNIISTLFLVVEPIIVIYFGIKGFSFAELSFALAALFLTPVIFEVPTGIIADIFGRKISVITSLLLVGLVLLIVPFISNIITLTLLFIFWGISRTLSTGADQAWIVDNLKKNKREDLISEYYLKNRSFNRAAFVFSGLLAAGLILLFGTDVVMNIFGTDLIGYDLLWFFESLGIIIAAIILMFVKERYIPRKIPLKHIFKHSIVQLKSGFKHSFQNPVIFHLILAAFFIALAGGMFGILYQPFLLDLGVPTHYLGYMVSIFGLIGIFLPFVAKRLFDFVKKEKMYLTFVAVTEAILTFAIFFVVSPLAGIAFIIVVANIGDLEKPIQRPYFQKHLTSKLRATVASFESMFVHFGAAIAMLLAGFLADLIGPKITFALSGLLIIPAIISYLTIHERK
jgi:MFS family permease